MPRMLITHNVVDVESWPNFKEERARDISAMGGSHVVDYAAQDGSNSVAIAADVADVAAVMAALPRRRPNSARRWKNTEYSRP